ncbi:hypothetical protein [Tardiphaga sp.]|uniref:hypothetical protein n=1 Tax=Tardiphaga sp. TaxID=1926292 RepID=UPI0026308DB2|nr:hypothetical protein [Tardiphaga sp.]MDB5619605.1 hypothetical protein [Tardiphaga sp.]
MLSVALALAASGLWPAWPARRPAGAALGGTRGTVVGAALIMVFFRTRLPMGF